MDMASLVTLLGTATDPTADPLTPLLGQGILGLVCVLTIIGARYVIGEMRASRDREIAALREELTRAIADRDAALDRLATSTAFLQQDVIPLFTRTMDFSRAQLTTLHGRTHGEP